MADTKNPITDDPQVTVLRKVMGKLVPFLAILYAFNVIDRGNVSLAALQMKGDLSFSNDVYGTGAGIFFIGYFIFEVPSNLIMERVGARRWIARIMLTWGTVSASMMFVHNATTFYTLRFLLGVAEAGFYPGIILYFTYWIPGNVRAQVLARFLSLQAVFALASNPLGSILLKMNNVGGLRGWQWLFLIEGVPSFLLGFAVWRFLPDRPADAKWLTPAEKDWIVKSQAKDDVREEQVRHITFRSALTEPRILHLCAIFFITSTGGNAIGYFAPQLLKQISHGLWSDSKIAMVGIIPAIVGAAAMSLAAGHSDRSGARRRHVSTGYFIAGAAYIACIYAPSAWWIVAAFAINSLGERIAAGSYWAVTSNLMGVRAAAGGIALINSVGNLGGFFGPKLMGKLMDRSHGHFEYGLCLAGSLMGIGSMLALFLPKTPAKPDGPPTAVVIEETALTSGVETPY